MSESKVSAGVTRTEFLVSWFKGKARFPSSVTPAAHMDSSAGFLYHIDLSDSTV